MTSQMEPVSKLKFDSWLSLGGPLVVQWVVRNRFPCCSEIGFELLFSFGFCPINPWCPQVVLYVVSLCSRVVPEPLFQGLVLEFPEPLFLKIGWFLAGSWLVPGWFLVGSWMVLGWSLVGSWVVQWVVRNRFPCCSEIGFELLFSFGFCPINPKP